ncbi:MAG TPA: hypothetical protein VFM18_12660, partial [Methanosarcina sp.]|nr:hypothetical protein [Methanosarcina sp.]
KDKAAFRSEIYCIIGLLIYTPVRDLGLQVPCPSFSNLILSAAAISVVIFLMHITGYTQGWKRVIQIFVVLWIIFKLFGLSLINTSDDTCIAYLNDSEGLCNSLYQLLALMGCGVIYRLQACSIDHKPSTCQSLCG